MKTTVSKSKGAGSDQPENDFPKIGQPATRALAGIGVQKLKQLTRFSESEILQLHGVGSTALGLLRQALADKGLSFAGEKKSSTKKTALEKH